ncbi:Erythropoietin receptor [Liparis tanakae]|uniref:Erythropoietin receptor n=1 Tax=Liparis tanakae TaxID=230148 RepID=A0A4Z2FKB6_9TELE|nr:Erythropoietin receptor [Liparis tanakae]
MELHNAYDVKPPPAAGPPGRRARGGAGSLEEPSPVHRWAFHSGASPRFILRNTAQAVQTDESREPTTWAQGLRGSGAQGLSDVCYADHVIRSGVWESGIEVANRRRQAATGRPGSGGSCPISAGRGHNGGRAAAPWSGVFKKGVGTEFLPVDAAALMINSEIQLDLLIVSLTLIISFILIALSVTILMSQRRLVKNKIWPVIPTPDSKFHGLFSVYGGDFKAWLGQTGGGLWLTPQSFYSDECPSPLEVLSELGPAPPPTAPGRKEEDADAVRGLDQGEPSESAPPAPAEHWRAAPHDPWLMDRLRELHRNQKSSPLESQDAYVTLSGDNHGDEGGHPDAALEEASPLEVLFACGKTASCESHSDLGSAPRSSGLGGLSSQCSFEDQNQRKEPGYTYMAVADSGVSMDYSPMSRGDDIGIVAIYANEYENQIPGHRRPFRPSQHPDG